jgi:hypothetical protein
VLPGRNAARERHPRDPASADFLPVQPNWAGCFGRLGFDGNFYTTSERIAFGQGDLHLPMGWGDIPWAEILPACRSGPASS